MLLVKKTKLAGLAWVVEANGTRYGTSFVYSPKLVNILHNFWQAVLLHALVNVKSIKAEWLPTFRHQIVVAYVILWNLLWIGVVGIAVGFYVYLAGTTVNGKIERIVAAVYFDKFLSFGLDVQTFQF